MAVHHPSTAKKMPKTLGEELRALREQTQTRDYSQVIQEGIDENIAKIDLRRIAKSGVDSCQLITDLRLRLSYYKPPGISVCDKMKEYVQQVKLHKGIKLEFNNIDKGSRDGYGDGYNCSIVGRW